MKISKTGIELIKKYESCNLLAYHLNGEKYWTIGWGHNGPDVKQGMVISQAKADLMLAEDLERYEKYTMALTNHLRLNQNQFDALVSFCYNCGPGTLKKLLDGRNMEEIAQAFPSYNHWNGKEHAMLTKRRKEEQALFLKPVRTIMNTAEKVINIALAEVGYLEKSKAAYIGNKDVLYEKVAGAGQDNYTKYGYEMHKIYPTIMDFPAYWCDAFVDWCFQKAYGITTAKSLLGGNFDDYTVASCSMYQKHNALGNVPKKGAQVFFTRNGKPSGCHHTGIVYKVDSKYFYTVEGNTSGASGVVSNGGGVAKKKYAMASYKNSVLFGYPKYDVITNKDLENVAKEVIAGRWGNGAVRKEALTAAGYNYEEVRAMVNKLYGKKN